MQQSEAGATALITGASGGIGYELAQVFARNGHGPESVSRDWPRLDQLADESREK